MGIISAVLWAILVGAVIGSLGRLVVPGPQHIGFVRTVVLGIAGAVVGGLIGGAAALTAWVTFVIEVLVAAFLLALFTGAIFGGRRGGRVYR